MSLTGIITRPKIQGTLGAVGPWQAIVGRQGHRIYPYQVGAMVRTSSTGTSVDTHGLGQFAQNDYLIVCKATLYGGIAMYIPDLTRVTRISSDPTAAVDDVLTIAPAVAVTAGEYLLNIGPDGAANPLVARNYDGSNITLYTDNAGNNANANPYLTTGQGGHYLGWLSTGLYAVDLMVTDASGQPLVVSPFVDVDDEVQQW